MFAVPASTCTNVRRHKDNKATSSLFHSIKTRVEKLQKTSLMKCQSQLASLQLIHKSWWQCRLPSLLNWQEPKEAHLPGITPPFRFAFPWIIWKSPRGNKFQLIYFLLGAFSTLPGLKASSNNSTYTHTQTESQILTLLCNRPVTRRYEAESCWQMLQYKPHKNLQVWRRKPLFLIYAAPALGAETHPKWEIIFFSHWLFTEEPFYKSLLCSSWMSGPANQNILL